MRILIVGLNYSPEKVGIAVYTTGLAEYLVAEGNEVKVVAGNPYYPSWQPIDGFKAGRYSHQVKNGVKVTWVPHYIPRNPTGGKRLLHHISFALSSLLPAIKEALSWKPHIVITIAPSLIAAPVARLAALICGAKSWLHLQDFEVEAAFATNLLTGGGVVKGVALYFERIILCMFHSVSTISPQMCLRLIAKGIPSTQISEFRNWADLEGIKPAEHFSTFRRRWAILTPYVALYSGNIGNKQGVELIVEAARNLQHRDDLTFVVCGEGPRRKEMEMRAADLKNIQFHDLQPREQLNDLLALATIHLMPQTAGAADLLLPSKLTNMLASGRPIVTTAEKNTSLAVEVEGCGITVPPSSPSKFAGAIEELLTNTDLYERASRASRQRAEQNWDAQVILGELHRKLHHTVEGVRPEHLDVGRE
ncbi:WcaI family glycosyltransferase [Devosia sp. BSSL-BM10]|uniref:WcaI family glycosyltransferase n=1 Tax=Devosia litorisediminis TaxID=2829817 RepID=A0A942I5V8_9HYPH|nr:WcaI family glycosyltransferase [Devosia litorisediminis]